MPREFDVTVSSPATVDQVHSAFGTAGYWEDRFAAFDATMTLDEIGVGHDGTVRVSTTQDLRRDALPPLLARCYPGDLEVHATETWTPVAPGRVEGAITIRVAGAPGSGSAAAVLEPDGTGSRLRVIGAVRVGIPLVGGRVEKYLASGFAAHIPEIQDFTTDWIASRV
ncbi:DUF2505 domain-containing protein [Tsukamurella soli]|uniref:DUF2505 domain-containing protein n=1 Tax=Tsukamurella soli TaxID=644556 RepID=A0ABP8KCF6_9ACTN